MIDEVYLRKMFGEWFDAFAEQHELNCISWDSLFTSVKRYILQILCERDGITQEKAIDYLRETGWLVRHDRAMSLDSISAVVNSLMRDGNKTISINVYPWKEDDE